MEYFDYFRIIMEILGYWKSCFDVDQSDYSSDDERRSDIPQQKRRASQETFSRTSKSRTASRYISADHSPRSLTNSLSTSNTSMTKRISRTSKTSTSTSRTLDISRTPTTIGSRKKLSLSEIKETWYDYSDTSDWSDDSMVSDPSSSSFSSSSSSSSLSSLSSTSSSPPTSVTSGYCEGSDSSSKYNFDRMSHSDDSSDSHAPATRERLGRDTKDYYYYPVRVTFHSQNSIDSALDNSSRSSIYSNDNQYAYISTNTRDDFSKPVRQSTGFGYNRWYKQSNAENKNTKNSNTEGKPQQSVKQSKADNISVKGRQLKVYQPSRGFGYNRWYQPNLSVAAN
ncbi:hypothetical protein LOTGIDRAFT_172104 [Lottia gigantea]|uniref:Uncharacterized protein n=1 Tax=Lottia gigantea TaxID=225164 RepID=V4B9X4_LOTGI|nr:hypothetical protein LOTGIDRAFT_172104 [Lottia gigantea]ESP02352.1 hypothetical protein LOTGIDRAFT_172104 [Lottia gigantea]